MPTISKTKEDLKDLETVQFITGALLEISTERMKVLRTTFERNRKFYEEIGTLYSVVKIQMAKHANPAVPRANVRQGVSVALTSNERFYGSINRDVVDAFVRYARDEGTDGIVIGKTGEDILRRTEARGAYSYTSFTSDMPTGKEAAAFLKQLSPYRRVNVFFPRFINVVNREVGMVDITHTPDPADVSSYDIGHIFEPELSKIAAFFETRVRRLLFQHALLESELARTAARMMSMSSAEAKAREAMKAKRIEMRKAQSLVGDLRLMESLAGISVWKKK